MVFSSSCFERDAELARQGREAAHQGAGSASATAAPLVAGSNWAGEPGPEGGPGPVRSGNGSARGAQGSAISVRQAPENGAVSFAADG